VPGRGKTDPSKLIRRSSDARARRSCLPVDGGVKMESEDAAPALAVVDARFCLSDAASLTAATTPSMTGRDFAVTDAATGALVLRVDGVLFSLRRRCVLVDADRRPVLTVQGSVGHPSTPSAPPSSFFSPCIYPRADFFFCWWGWRRRCC
jgi:hypothetical protein